MKILLVMTIVMVSAYVSACGDATGEDGVEKQIVKVLEERKEKGCFHDKKGYYDIVSYLDDVLYIDSKHMDKKALEILLEQEAIVLNDSHRYSYIVTEVGKEFIFDKEGICIGNFEFDSLVSFTEPAVDSGVLGTNITFKVKFEPSDWYKKLGMPLGVPKTVSMKNPHGSTDEIQERFTIFQKMNHGWAKVDDEWNMLD